MKKYLVCPGYVTSRHDGDRHYIGAESLMHLYGVKQEECVVWDGFSRWPEDLIPLRPRFRGDYEGYLDGVEHPEREAKSRQSG